MNGITNGVSKHDYTEVLHSPDANGDAESRVARLQEELERTREERETYASQYRELLARLTTMRSTLGNKLKQDAEELDRREQTIATLTLQQEDLQSTVQTLQSELIESNAESERVSNELELMRSRALEYEQTSHEAMMRERELREVRNELEMSRIARDEIERLVQQERLASEQTKEQVEELSRDLESAREGKAVAEEELRREQERCFNLQSVLEDFQSTKELELRRAVEEQESHLNSVTQALAEYKHRALQAELQLEETSSSSSRVKELEDDLKEKNAVIGKLRHQTVVLNEHLTEALRRLNKNSGDNNVDRRLVTNVLISFLNTPRGDSKRFEMLNILATVLSWEDAERERAGLQRLSSSTDIGHGRPLGVRRASSSQPSEGSEHTESFSQMWVEYLLKEAGQGASTSAPRETGVSPSHSNPSLPSSPSLTPGVNGQRRLASFGAAMASSPNLHSHLNSPPSRKGKGPQLL
ncbi:hypothetical protein SISSUDRAFT_1072462 [Sistotremastrum suecicum HHB10207 ss-3]|uniref:GRIP domain-containing protein n=1 Tax=Sistotremastrum suecicum HHB10207 ss-3 TaxID=1314776 RepID=A0A165Y191_9AGAM|nr:hypothetical protein SISSUDRAFT_1072462 [Sistotremastrum suecicum HHB10207 ss-3]